MPHASQLSCTAPPQKTPAGGAARASTATDGLAARALKILGPPGWRGLLNLARGCGPEFSYCHLATASLGDVRTLAGGAATEGDVRRNRISPGRRSTFIGLWPSPSPLPLSGHCLGGFRPSQASSTGFKWMSSQPSTAIPGANRLHAVTSIPRSSSSSRVPMTDPGWGTRRLLRRTCCAWVVQSE